MLIIDLDKNKCLFTNTNNEIEQKQQDFENTTFKMPTKIVNELKTDLLNLVRISKLKTESQKNIELCLIFLKFFIKTIGNYKEFIIPLETNIYGNREQIFLVNYIIHYFLNFHSYNFIYCIKKRVKNLFKIQKIKK